MTPAQEIAARLASNAERAETINRLQERLARLIAEQEAAWVRIHELQVALCPASPAT